MSKLTQKEFMLLSDLLNYEEACYKKTELYAKTITDSEIASQMKSLSQNHAKRYQKLLNLLWGDYGK